jgi:hypothetical protein
MHDCFSNRDLVPLHISVLVHVKLCTKSPIDRGPTLIDVLHSLAGGKGQEVHTIIDAFKSGRTVPTALAGAAKMRATFNSYCWNVAFVHNHLTPPLKSRMTSQVRALV